MMDMDSEVRIVRSTDRLDVYDLPWKRRDFARPVYVAVNRRRLYVRVWIRAWCIWFRAKTGQS